eukprot:scaffold2134_cov93-Cylindrotheca_fusiformis.AAC.17
MNNLFGGIVPVEAKSIDTENDQSQNLGGILSLFARASPYSNGRIEQWMFNEPMNDAFEPTPIADSQSSSNFNALFDSLDEALDVMGDEGEWPPIQDMPKQTTSMPVTQPGEGDRQQISVFRGNARFRPYQANQWEDRFKELLDYKNIHGHCRVPHQFSENPSIARWVKRQRYQYKLMCEGKPSTMTLSRARRLEEAGFVWDAHNLAWEERLCDLQQYLSTHGDCNVPTVYPANKQLATWVKCQRRQYKLFRAGKTSTITKERIRKLNSMGFTWELRGSKK